MTVFFTIWFQIKKKKLYVSSEDKQKSIDIETACELLEIVLGSQFRPQVDKLIAYLKVTSC